MHVPRANCVSLAKCRLVDILSCTCCTQLEHLLVLADKAHLIYCITQ